jgi:hypothetical protein
MTHWRETPQEVALRVKAWRAGYGDWWRSYLWSHFVHLTVGGRWSPDRLRQCFQRKFIRFTEKTTQGPVPHIYVIEGGALGDQPHLHALIYGTDRLERGRLEQAWRYGRAHVAVYDRTLAGTHYMAKEIGGRILDYGTSTRRPPLL